MTFRGTERFEVVRTLGRGGMGVVYEAMDRTRGARVAIKTLPDADAELLLRLKNEFRALQDLAHENLVNLGELVEADGAWFFTMELIDGVDLLRWARPGAADATSTSSSGTDPTAVATPTTAPRPGAIRARRNVGGTLDEARLRDAVRQLARGLAALHDAGKVHRDVKPSNVMVTRDGRVVLLDFGLVAQAAAAVPDGQLVGTLPYLAPEMIDGTPSAAGDQYALGVVLFEALTGELPFDGHGLDVMMRKGDEAPPSPSARADAVPEDLDALCVALLDRDPARRPSAREVILRLGGARAPEAATPFVGRDAELARLGAALAASRDAAAGVIVRGESGVGKTALTRELTERVAARGGVVLAGRCHPREAVPFQAVDGVVDALSELLVVSRFEPVPALADAAAMFPVLARVEGAGAPPTALDPVERRRRATAALRDQLAAIAAASPLVIVIDDLQWADADGLALLAELLRPPGAPRALVLATARGDGGALPEAIPTETLALGRLSLDDARALVAQLVDPAHADDVAAMAAESGGHPLFVAELARHAGTARGRALDDALGARVAELPAAPRRVLELAAMISGPASTAVLARAASLDAAAADLAIAALRGAHLARTSGVHRIEPFHDRVREVTIAQLDAETRRARHRALADALAALAPDDHEARATHLREAGEPGAAVAHVRAAAARANVALAFDRAASLWQLALDLAPDDDALVARIALADALANAGRGAEAGQAYLATAAIAPPGDALGLEALGAEELLHAGHLGPGLASISRALGEVGLALPRSPRRALPGLLVRRARIRLRGLGFRPRAAAEVPPAELAKIDLCWSVATGLALVDHFRGADFQARHLLLALAAGEPYRATRALILEACYAATAGSRGEARTAAVLAAATDAAARTGDPHALALVEHATSVAAYCRGDFAGALRHADLAQEIMRTRCARISWELSDAQMFAMHALAALGDLAELCRRLPRHRAEAARRGNLWSVTNFCTGALALDALVDDDPEAARRRAAEALARWSDREFLFQDAMYLFGETQVDLYEGHAVAARARLDRSARALRRSMLLDIQVLRIQFAELRARCALRLGDLAAAERERLALSREGPAFAAALAALIAGQLAAARGDADAADQLAAAEGALTASDLHLHAIAARRARGVLVEDAALVDSADGWLRDHGVRAPARLAAMIVGVDAIPRGRSRA